MIDTLRARPWASYAGRKDKIMTKSEAIAATTDLALSNRTRKRVVAALSGWHGARILAAHGGDASAAARAIESVRGNAHRANLAAQAGRA